MAEFPDGAAARLRRRATGPWRHPARAVLTGAAVLVVAGTLLLWLPASHGAAAGGRSTGFVAALFTAVSAVTCTGLAVVDTGALSGFGQVVVLLLVEAGGLGLMVAASLLGIVVAGRLGLPTRLLSGRAGHPGTVAKVGVPMVRRIVRGVLLVGVVVQAVALVLVTARLWLGHGRSFVAALHEGLFLSASAFSNAAFTLRPGGLVPYRDDVLLLLPVLAAVVVGGVGYPVLLEMRHSRHPADWSVHTRLTLAVTGLLVVLGPLVVTASEWTNPATIGGLDAGHRLIAGIAGGITPRTSGLATFDWARADPATQLFTTLLMVIGGGSAGTAGGIKVTTVAVLVLAVRAEARGGADVDVFARRIAPGTVRQAIAVGAFAFVTVIAAALVLLELTDARLDEVLFEVTSAFSTAGLTTGLARDLPDAGRLVIAALMVAGRVGPVTLATALALRTVRRPFRNPQSRPIVG